MDGPKTAETAQVRASGPSASRMAAAGKRPMRRDAEQNRQRLLAEAREVFLDCGLDAPLKAVARRSGVGMATLHRHFPSRGDLIAAVLSGQVDACVDGVVVAAQEPSAWRGFSVVVERLLVLDAVNRVLFRGFSPSAADRIDLAARRDHAEQVFADLVRRAKAEGSLRQDFHRRDLDLVLTLNSGLERLDPDLRPLASQRFAALALRGFATDTGTVTPEKARRPAQRPLPLLSPMRM
ncbi:TetR/AcrR family transcriptional regulator [Actinoplanes sp. NPDC000266]